MSNEKISDDLRETLKRFDDRMKDLGEKESREEEEEREKLRQAYLKRREDATERAFKRSGKMDP